jgi:hypothetical protein
MGQVYYFQDPLPLIFGDATNGPCFNHDHDQNGYDDEYMAEDGWPDPGPCPICGTPHTACVGPTTNLE